MINHYSAILRLTFKKKNYYTKLTQGRLEIGTWEFRELKSGSKIIKVFECLRRNKDKEKIEGKLHAEVILKAKKG